ELFTSLNHASLKLGEATIYRSLCYPLNSIDHLIAKQTAIKELQNDKPTLDNAQKIIEEAKNDEKYLYQLFYGKFLGALSNAQLKNEVDGFGYESYKRGTRFFLNLVAGIKQSPQPQSGYLQQIFNTLSDFSNSRAFSLMEGPVYRGEKGIQSKQDRQGSFSPAFRFKPTLFKPFFILGVIALLMLLGYFYPSGLFGASSQAVPIVSIFGFPLLLIYIPVVGSYDRDSCVYPLRDEFKTSPEVQKTLDALGKLDELIAFIKYSENYGTYSLLPTMIPAENHQLDIVNANNPVLGYQNPEYVPNSLSLTTERIAFITGPNSGGKTAFCKTITQIQLLAQIGCFVPASSAKLSVADKIYYQVPVISHLNDGEGRFGTELRRTKEIFTNTTSNSLVILDELSEGTTFEEKMENSINILEGFYHKGNNTILITHNHQLVDHFIDAETGIARQVEFKNDQATFRLIQGISRISHADKVAKRIGFSKEDIKNLLQK
ncbi:MAG: DNA mismatch repair protein MutS, partial [Methylococcaceae bacterium]